MKTAVFSVDPGAMGLAGDGAGGVFPAPVLHFGWRLIFGGKGKCLTMSLDEQNIWS